MYACICRRITEAAVRQAGHAGVTTPEDLILLFRLDDAACCGRCARQPERLLALATEGAAHWDRGPATALPTAPWVLVGAAGTLVRAAAQRVSAGAWAGPREA